MSEKCYRCFRPLESCYCKYIVPVQTNVKFVFLMHPKEAYKQKTGTGRLASLSLPDSEIIIAVDFSKNYRLQELLSDERFLPFLLYPGNDAYCASDSHFAQSVVESKKKLLVIVVDATWFCAKKMVHLSTNLHQLPKLSFKSGYRSKFTFKRQPRPECLSTIESCYYLIRELQASGFVDATVDPEPLLSVFNRMIDFQLTSQKEREKSGAPDRYWNSKPRSKHSH